MDFEQIAKNLDGSGTILPSDILLVIRNGKPYQTTAALIGAAASLAAIAEGVVATGTAGLAVVASESTANARTALELGTAAQSAATDFAAAANGVPTLPGAGTFSLKSIDGVMSWVEDA